MESKELLEALETLKKSLEQINSAREQVESTVSAYNELETELGKYTKTLGETGMNITSLLDKTMSKEESLSTDIEASKTQFVSLCENVTNEHKAAMNEVTGFFQATCSSTSANFTQ